MNFQVNNELKQLAPAAGYLGARLSMSGGRRAIFVVGKRGHWSASVWRDCEVRRGEIDAMYFPIDVIDKQTSLIRDRTPNLIELVILPTIEALRDYVGYDIDTCDWDGTGFRE